MGWLMFMVRLGDILYQFTFNNNNILLGVGGISTNTPSQSCLCELNKLFIDPYDLWFSDLVVNFPSDLEVYEWHWRVKEIYIQNTYTTSAVVASLGRFHILSLER